LHLEKVLVSTRFPGAEDHLPERFLVPHGDESLLHSMIEDTLSQLDGARIDFIPVWQRARAELTIDHMVEQTSRVYHQILSRAA
jgi:hypothetical protein